MSNGPLRAQSNGFIIHPDIQSILRREGIRQLPGICWYPVKAHRLYKQVNQGGTTDKEFYSPLTEQEDSVKGVFVVSQNHKEPLTDAGAKQGGKPNVADQTMASGKMDR